MKVNNKKSSYINRTIADINKFSRMLKEAYIFDDEEQEPIEEPIEYEQDMEMPRENQTDDTIDKIRMLALQGIQEYAEDVDNEMYITFKKIWQMCDKCLSEKDKVEE